MSFREVTSLRRAGRLQEAYNMAKADLEQERSNWTYSAMFWVLSDYGKQYIANGQREKARACLNEMISLFEGMNDDEGYAERAIKNLNRQLIPNWNLVYNMSELAKAGNEEEAFNRLMEVHKETPLDVALHDDFGWVIYRYLDKRYGEIGSEKARKALAVYMNLKNERPSLLHSQILNVATKISEKYDDFKFLPFLRMWNVVNFSDDDFHESYWGGKEISPLVERIIERCFKLGYGLNEVIDAFGVNPKINNVVDVFSRYNFFEINRLYNGEVSLLINRINEYLNAINGKELKNEFHSKILSMYLRKFPEDIISEVVPAMAKWGFNNFRNEDWKREVYEEKEMPSLVEKAVGRYLKALKLHQYQDTTEAFIELLNEAISRYIDDDQLIRNLALIRIAQGEKDEALSIYRSLLLKLNRFYIWKELSEATDDKALKISALCKAIISEPQDKFLGNVHLALADLLIEDNQFKEAKVELNTFKKTYQSEGWGPNDEYKRLVKLIPDSVSESVTEDANNKQFYLNHILTAEEFVYSDIEWTTLVVCDIYTQKNNNKEIEKAKLVSADGVEISVRLNSLKEKKSKVIGTCYDVKIIKQEDGKFNVGLLKKSIKNISDILPTIICYVDFYNKEKKCYHLVSQKNKQMILRQNVQLKEGQFCSCYEVPQSDKDRAAYAFFAKLEEPESAIMQFPSKVAVVDHINEAKQLFHCVFGRGMDIIIKYSETQIRPKIGDYVLIHYIWKKLKDGRIIRKMLSIDYSDNNDLQLKKSIKGSIRLNYNFKGQLFGFVGDYYVPNHLVKGVEEGDYVKADVVFNGEKWEVYHLEVDNTDN